MQESPEAVFMIADNNSIEGYETACTVCVCHEICTEIVSERVLQTSYVASVELLPYSKVYSLSRLQRKHVSFKG